MLVGHEPRAAISCHPDRPAVQRLAGARGARCGAGARSSHHRSIGAARTRSWTIGPRRHAAAERSSNVPLTNSQLFALPSMVPVRQAIDAEFDRYIARHKASLPNETIGVGDGFDFQLFDRAQLYSPDTRFVLAGIVNRMDRAYVSEASCGEIRLIYRLTRTDVPLIGENAVSQRLPMTLNLVLKAKGGPAIDHAGAAITCAEIARRWLAAGELSLTGSALAEKLSAKDGPLDLIDDRNIDRDRDQPSDRACAEIGGTRFPHRLSVEGFRLRRAGATLRGSAAGKPDRPGPDSGRRQSETGFQDIGCSTPNILANSTAARS